MVERARCEAFDRGGLGGRRAAEGDQAFEGDRAGAGGAVFAAVFEAEDRFFAFGVDFGFQGGRSCAHRADAHFADLGGCRGCARGEGPKGKQRHQGA